MTPFTISVPQAALDDLHRRLAATRWAEDIPDLALIRSLRDEWLRFDWRAVERRWNTLPHYRTVIHDLAIHFIHVRSDRPDARPLILTHGWPGSFAEMLQVLPLLRQFHVVIPSLPGFGFSDPPRRTGVNTYVIAAAWVKLMQSLGYERFFAQGGDFGANVTTVLGWKHAQHIEGIHLNYIPSSYKPFVDQLSGEERAFHEADARWWDENGAYAHVQRTQPETLAYALNDSPMGLAAWIVDKFQRWAGSPIPMEEILANVTLYWLTGTIHSSSRLYVETRKAPLSFAPGERIRVPCAIAHFPKEEPFPPRSWVERVYDVHRWTEMPRGGHFAALEEPELLAGDVSAAFA